MVLAQKKRNIDQWNRTEWSQINSCFWLIIYNKSCKNIQWIKVSPVSSAGKTEKKKEEEEEEEHSLTLYIRINSKRIKELNASQDTIRLRGKHKNTL